MTFRIVQKTLHNTTEFLHNRIVAFDKCQKTPQIRIKKKTMPPHNKFKASDESVNSKGFWVLTKGIELPKNGIVPVFYNHETSGKLPIGRAENFVYEADGSLTCDIVFDQSDEFAKTVERKVNEGFINSCSIGIIVKETSKDKSLLKENQTKYTVTKSRLSELSITPMPSNENALKLSAENGQVFELAELATKENKIKAMEDLQELLKKYGISLAELNLDDKATDEQIVAAIQQKLSATQTPTPPTAEEALAAKVLVYGRKVAVVNDTNESHFKKLALSHPTETMEVIASLATAQKPTADKNEGKESEKLTKLSEVLQELKQKQTPEQKGVGDLPKTPKTLEQRLAEKAMR